MKLCMTHRLMYRLMYRLMHHLDEKSPETAQLRPFRLFNGYDYYSNTLDCNNTVQGRPA